MRKLKRDEVKKKSFFSTHTHTQIHSQKKIHIEERGKKLRGFLWPLLLKSFSTYNAGYREMKFSFFISVFLYNFFSSWWMGSRQGMNDVLYRFQKKNIFFSSFCIFISCLNFNSNDTFHLLQHRLTKLCVLSEYICIELLTYLLTYLLILLKLYRVNKKIEFRLQFDFMIVLFLLAMLRKGKKSRWKS